MSTEREIVRRTLEMNNPERIPRQMWFERWAPLHHPKEFAAIQRDYPDDIVWCDPFEEQTSPGIKGISDMPGEYIDDWGCIFTNVLAGVIGEVKQPIVTDDDWDYSKVHVPTEWMSVDIKKVNDFCHSTTKYVLGGRAPRPFEQLQFIRGTENLYMDFMDEPPLMMEFMEKMHEFYCALIRKWCETDVDGIMFQDDWGAQRSLLISPHLWKKYFRHMYWDYIDIIHKAGKTAFMHSDGYILDILPDLIDMKLDAVNAQLFCMGFDRLQQYRGKITFWGEIDRQNILPRGSLQDVQTAVQTVYDTLYANGGIIAQCDFGNSAKPENVRHVFECWNRY